MIFEYVLIVFICFSHRTENNLDERDEEDIVLASVPVVQRDLLNALEKLQSEFAEAIGAPKVEIFLYELSMDLHV